MTAATSVYHVASLGFEERERRALRSVLAMHEHRIPRFRPFVPAPGQHPHIVVVNAERPEALRNWERYQRQCDPRARVMPLFISRHPLPRSLAYTLPRPIVATRLFAILEQIAVEQFAFLGGAAVELEEEPFVVLAPELAPAPVLTRAQVVKTLAPAPVGNRSHAPRGRVTGGPDDMVALVVDDSLPARIQMQTALRSIAAHVDFADSGEAALELIEQKRYSIVFLDVVLPGKDGYDVCRAVKKHPQQQRTPVVMLTGNSSPADRVKGRLAGCDTYLIKPIRQSVLESVVKEVVSGAVAA